MACKRELPARDFAMERWTAGELNKPKVCRINVYQQLGNGKSSLVAFVHKHTDMYVAGHGLRRWARGVC